MTSIYRQLDCVRCLHKSRVAVTFVWLLDNIASYFAGLLEIDSHESSVRHARPTIATILKYENDEAPRRYLHKTTLFMEFFFLDNWPICGVFLSHSMLSWKISAMEFHHRYCYEKLLPRIFVGSFPLNSRLHLEIKFFLWRFSI